MADSQELQHGRTCWQPERSKPRVKKQGPNKHRIGGRAPKTGASINTRKTTHGPGCQSRGGGGGGGGEGGRSHPIGGTYIWPFSRSSQSRRADQLSSGPRRGDQGLPHSVKGDGVRAGGYCIEGGGGPAAPSRYLYSQGSLR